MPFISQKDHLSARKSKAKPRRQVFALLTAYREDLVAGCKEPVEICALAWWSIIIGVTIIPHATDRLNDGCRYRSWSREKKIERWRKK